MHIRVSLSEGTFRELVKGEVVKVADFSIDGLRAVDFSTDEGLLRGAVPGYKHELLVSLQDIGWDRMMKAVQDAYENRWLTRKPTE